MNRHIIMACDMEDIYNICTTMSHVETQLLIVIYSTRRKKYQNRVSDRQQQKNIALGLSASPKLQKEPFPIDRCSYSKPSTSQLGLSIFQKIQIPFLWQLLRISEQLLPSSFFFLCCSTYYYEYIHNA